MISIFDERLYQFYLRAEAAGLRCEPVAFSATRYRVTSEGDPRVLYDVRIVETAQGPCVVCNCREVAAGIMGAAGPCKHAALAAADFSEDVRIAFARRRAEEAYRERVAVLEGRLPARKLRGMVRSYERAAARAVEGFEGASTVAPGAAATSCDAAPFSTYDS